MMRYVAVAVLVTCACASWTRVAAAGIADFENYTEGADLGTSFVDPTSGIGFSHISGPNEPFTIEFAAPSPTTPNVRSSHYLTAGGYGVGDGFAVPFEFGFRGTLPTPADRITVSFLYDNFLEPSPSLRLEAFDEFGNPVAATVIGVPMGIFVESSIAVQSTEVNIRSFTLVPHDIFLIYDNITFVPEPSFGFASSMFALLTLALRPTRSRASASQGPDRRAGKPGHP